MRKADFYPKMALTNIRNNRKLYIPYFLTCMASVATMHIMLFINGNEGLTNMLGGDYIRIFMAFGCIIVGIFATIVLFYTNSFLMKRRKKELGLYNILGMEKRHIAAVLFYETVFTGAASIVAGLLAGLIFSKLSFAILCRLLRFPVPLGFNVSLSSIGIAAVLFAGIFLLILVSNMFQIRLNNPIQLLQGGSVGQREPKSNFFLAFVGILALGGGYAIAILTKSPLSAISMFFLAVILVIIGTYCLFTAGSIVLLKALRRNKKYYYKTEHFTTVSGMIHRMKQNAVGLSNICILSTMVLVMMSTTVSLYIGMEDIIDARYPYDISVSGDGQPEEQISEILDAINSNASQKGLEVKKLIRFNELRLAAERQENTFLPDSKTGNGIAGLSFLTFITQDGYRQLTGSEANLKSPADILIYSPELPVGDKIKVLDIDFNVARHLDSAPFGGEYISWLVDTHYVVVYDTDVLNRLYLRQKEVCKTYYLPETYIQFDITGTKEEKLDFADTLRENLSSFAVTETEDGETHTYPIYVECRQAGADEYYMIYGGFLFLGIFLGLLFMLATIMIIYYKQITEGYEDKERFAIMQKVGMSREEVKSSIKSQVLTVFFLPLVTAGVHVCFAFPIITKLLATLHLTNVSLYALCAVGTFAIFALCYAAIYTLTARAYYKIVQHY
ncbi:MAG: FtsX-like permease family protein [Oscillospiraceae bacterium]